MLVMLLSTFLPTLLTWFLLKILFTLVCRVLYINLCSKKEYLACTTEGGNEMTAMYELCKGIHFALFPFLFWDVVRDTSIILG